MPPHASPRIATAVGALALAAVSGHAARSYPGLPRPIRAWPRFVVEQLRADLSAGGRPARLWAAIAGWSVLVSILHFGGLEAGRYSAVAWWDLLTHAMGASGVAAVLTMGLRRRAPEAIPWWIVASTVAIGGGFEVYEFLFKGFWYDWSLWTYAVDTAVDMVVNGCAATGVLVAVTVGRRWADSSDTPRYSPSD